MIESKMLYTYMFADIVHSEYVFFVIYYDYHRLTSEFFQYLFVLADQIYSINLSLVLEFE
jgi:hypothetical protein